MLAYTARGDVLEIDPGHIGRGGEGKVHALPAHPELLAKIFHRPQNEDKDQEYRNERHEKLQELIAHPFPAPDGRFAWPEELLYDAPGGGRRFLGYLMAQIANGKPLGEFFVPTTPQFQQHEKSFRVRLAIAVAEIFVEVHRHHLQVVVGDVSDRNLLVDDQGRVTLIDLDSVQITTQDGRTYRSRAWTAYYTPAELIGKDLARETRRPEHDRFGLAVLIFELLFDGCHPFNTVGIDDLVEQIRAGAWPYAAGSPFQPPPQAPRFRDFPAEIQALFRRAFETGQRDPGARPTAEDWAEALARHEKALAKIRSAWMPVEPEPRAEPRRRPRLAVAASAAAVLIAVLGITARPLDWRKPTATPPPAAPLRVETRAVAAAPITVVQPPRRSAADAYWEQVREQEARWEDQMNDILNIVEEKQAAPPREPHAVATACLEQELEILGGGTSADFESLVRHGDALETGLVRVQKTARSLNNLLEQVPASHRAPLDPPRSLGEQELLWAVATLRQGGGPRAEAAAILQRVILDELSLIAEPLRHLHEQNIGLRRHFHRPDFPDPDPGYPYRWNLRDTIQRAVEFQAELPKRLGRSRARMLREPSSPARAASPGRRRDPGGPDATDPGMGSVSAAAVPVWCGAAVSRGLTIRRDVSFSPSA